MKKLITLITITIFLNSCTDFGLDENTSIDNRAYYQFSPTEQSSIPTFTKDQHITFKNQKHDTITYIMYRHHNNIKKLYAVGMGFLSTYADEYYYYDNVKYDFYNANGTGQFNLNFTKSPDDWELAKSNKTILQASSFHATINNFPGWNGLDNNGDRTGLIEIFKHKASKGYLNINGKSYYDVFFIRSNNTSTYDSSQVNTIYYKEQLGILGFDDLKGNKWRIKL